MPDFSGADGLVRRPHDHARAWRLLAAFSQASCSTRRGTGKGDDEIAESVTLPRGGGTASHLHRVVEDADDHGRAKAGDQERAVYLGANRLDTDVQRRRRELRAALQRSPEKCGHAWGRSAAKNALFFLRFRLISRVAPVVAPGGQVRSALSSRGS